MIPIDVGMEIESKGRITMNCGDGVWVQMTLGVCVMGHTCLSGY